MANCTARRRSSKRSNRHNKTNCWRNPLVVFFVCFAILGSLRFRVPARSKIVANNLLLKRREHQRRKREDKQLLAKAIGENMDISTGDTVPMNISANLTATTTLSYTLIESGKDANQRAFLKYRVVDMNDVPLTMEQWASAIVTSFNDDDPVVVLLNKLIADSLFRAVYFETPPFVPSTSTSSVPFEFVLMDAPKLHELASDHPDEAAFRVPLSSTTGTVSEYGAVFPNLGGDALLVVPKSRSNNSDRNIKCYAHLASFVRTGPPAQVAALWKLVAQAVLDRMATSDTSPFWLSTSGTGVYWLHFRLDRTPKYYTYDPYKQQQPYHRP